MTTYIAIFTFPDGSATTIKLVTHAEARRRAHAFDMLEEGPVLVHKRVDDKLVQIYPFIKDKDTQ